MADEKKDYAGAISAQIGNQPSESKADDKETGDEKPVETKAEKSELEMDDVEPNDADKRNVAKKIEQQGYAIANLTKQLTEIRDAIKDQGGRPTPEQKAEVRQIAEELDDLKGREDEDYATVGDLKKSRSATSKIADLEKKLAQQEMLLADQEAERQFNRQFPTLNGQYEKFADMAWDDVNADPDYERMRDSNPEKIGAVRLAMKLRAKQAMKKAGTKSDTTATTEAAPKPSTKGAQITASKSAARDDNTAVDPNEKFLQYSKGIKAQLGF